MLLYNKIKNTTQVLEAEIVYVGEEETQCTITRL